MRVPSERRRRRTVRRRLAGLALLGWVGTGGGPAQAQPPPVPTTSFTLVGHIERFTLDNAGDPLSAAVMTVRGIPVVLPRNLLITLPGRYMTAQDLFRGPAGAAVLQESGLALADDTARPPVPFEAELLGNVVEETVNNLRRARYIAGVVRISQGALHIGEGYIQAIDAATGEMRIGDKLNTAGARVRLNDPTGIYGVAATALPAGTLSFDPRFALDEENAPVHARTGFPVCVPAPSREAACPPGNRLAGSLRFTCGKQATPGVAALHATCDPKRPVPLAVGDHVTYAGMIVPDPAGGFVVAAHGLEAELGIYTSPGVEPAYVFVEEAIQGTKGEEFAGIPQEETTRFRIVGFTSDPTRNVEVWLVDSDRKRPSPGAQDPPWPGTSFTGPGGLAPSNGPQLGRFRNTWPAKDDARPVRRDVLVRVVGTPWVKTPAGIRTNGYLAPVGEYIYPEPTSFGQRGFPVPVPFENFCFLRAGGGTHETVQGGTVTLGALDPFPDSGHAAPQPVGNGPRTACDGE
ncbi:hypothetical protein [Roseicella sp. DB1501]|uniref:hypothetical protein n=1 Tax=Roseicella sp. DB1501 TaxID=2730925 RepID=UPI0014926BB6|nr:hypothetical protein [Roseicella sp. DB1501]NOG72282.1 hypothetical protein [Roseicella sp. DB1501]